LGGADGKTLERDASGLSLISNGGKLFLKNAAAAQA